MKSKVLIAVVILVLTTGDSGVGVAEPSPANPLAAYVAKPDDSYGWVARRQGQLSGCEVAELTLTSQTWRDIVWKHQLFLVKPDQLDQPSHAMLLIDGGRWTDSLAQPPGRAENWPAAAVLWTQVARRIKSPLAVVRQVPYQPIFGGLVEDDAISYSFVQFLKTGDDQWPLLLPMVKSAVRAMDATQDFARRHWDLQIKTFTVTGASKRGWTAWLTGAVDARVTALAPQVIDVLNIPAHMKLQLETWGQYSEQIADYTRRGLQQQLATAAGNSLTAIIDPYGYRHALRQPKLIVLGTNDRYWPLDALNLYWNDLPGQKYILYVPNNGHGLRDLSRVIGSINALHQQAKGRLRLPRLDWQLEENAGKLCLRVRSDPAPQRVDAWMASSQSRDFRDARWTSQPARAANGEFMYEVPLPASGYLALFGEAVYQADGEPYWLSTNVKIVGARAGQ